MYLHALEISKVYPEKTVFENLTIQIDEPGIYAVLGDSGSGKTTLLRILAGLDVPSSGKTEKEGRIAYSFQEYRLFENLTAAQNISVILGWKDKEKAKTELMDFGFTEQETKLRPESLSGGMKQRVNLLRALCSGADICFLDEPTKELDETLKAKVWAKIREVSQKSIVLFTVHDEKSARAVTDRIIRITRPRSDVE